MAGGGIAEPWRLWWTPRPGKAASRWARRLRDAGRKGAWRRCHHLGRRRRRGHAGVGRQGARGVRRGARGGNGQAAAGGDARRGGQARRCRRAQRHRAVRAARRRRDGRAGDQRALGLDAGIAQGARQLLPRRGRAAHRQRRHGSQVGIALAVQSRWRRAAAQRVVGHRVEELERPFGRGADAGPQGQHGSQCPAQPDGHGGLMAAAPPSTVNSASVSFGAPDHGVSLPTCGRGLA